MTTINKSILIVFLIIFAIFFAYYDALNNAFLTSWDTGGYVVNNLHIRAFNWDNIYWMFTTFDMGNWHPLTWVSHALDYAFFGLDPWWHHFVNILIHSFNSILLFGLVIILISFKTQHIDNQTLLAAGIAAFLFGIHPQHVESVVWIAERKDVLCLFFILLTLISYVFYVQKERLSWYLLTVLCFIFAILAKPMAVTLPVILLLMDVYPLNRTRLTVSHAVSYKRLILEKIPFFSITLFSIILTLFAQQRALFPIEELGLIYRFLNACNTLFLYIAKFIFPVALSPFYPLKAPSNLHQDYLIFIPIIAAVFITLICAYFWYKKKYYWLITWLFYLVTLSPVIGIIQVGSQAAADRYTYFPTIPFYILLGIGCAKLFYTPKIKKQIQVASAIILLLVSVLLIQLTKKQTDIWQNDIIFWGYIAAYAPDSAIPQHHLGGVYSKIGRHEKALEHYLRAISIAPGMSEWYPAILRTYLILNRFEKALNLIKAPMEYDIDIGVSLDYLYYVKGTIYQKQGLPLKAREALIKAVELNPKLEIAQKLLLKINSENEF